jgi:NADH-quinone oxidoreductase subunit N
MIDNIALLPAYVAAATAIAVLLSDLVYPGRWVLPPLVGALGAAATAVAAVAVGVGSSRSSFCMSGGGCSYLTDPLAALVAVVFAVLTLGTLALSVPVLRAKIVPAGEYTFLLACSLTGGVVLGSARDLVLLVVAVETVTLPLYVLVGLRKAVASAEASLTFFVTSVVSTAIALLGAALLYAATGTVHLARLPGALADGGHPAATEQLIPVGIVLLLAGLGFKVAAVPLHSWAPKTYDGAPLPVAAFLSTASKLAGVVAIGLVAVALKPRFDVAGLTLAVLATLTMTVGNLVALRQRRMVRLLAWSSIAQAGYLLAPLGGLAVASDGGVELFAATIAYTVFFVFLEFGAFAAIIAVRGTSDGGRVSDFQGLARRAWLPTAALVLALTGLAGLPPGIAGLFAKVVVIKALVGSGTTWLAIVVALNAVIGLAYYARVVATLFGSPAGLAPGSPLVPLPRLPRSRIVLVTVAVVALAGVVVGLAPQPILDSARDAVAALP